MIRRVLRRLTGRRRRARRRQLWSIGIYAGPSPLDLRPAPHVSNPVLTRADVSDVPARFVADPFMIKAGDAWHMFFEVLNGSTRKGEIGLASSQDALRWQYQGLVLTEPYHLSYPYVFAYDGDYYMLPETYQARSVRLYRARRFPHDWALAATLLEGDFLVDASIVQAGDRWWVFVQTGETRFDVLRLFEGLDLMGPFREHPASPIVAGDASAARPAGRPVRIGDRLVRFAQDCRGAYGRAVRAFEVLTLTSQAYRERPLRPDPVLAGSGAGWNAEGMHHLDLHSLPAGDWIACVDGWTYAP